MSSLVMLKLSREFTLLLEFTKQASSSTFRQRESLLDLTTKALCSMSKLDFLKRAIKSFNRV